MKRLSGTFSRHHAFASRCFYRGIRGIVGTVCDKRRRTGDPATNEERRRETGIQQEHLQQRSTLKNGRRVQLDFFTHRAYLSIVHDQKVAVAMKQRKRNAGALCTAVGVALSRDLDQALVETSLASYLLAVVSAEEHCARQRQQRKRRTRPPGATRGCS